MVRIVVEEIAAREDRPFDAAWMRATFDRFWERHHWIEQFNNTLLEPLTPAGRLLLVAQYGSNARPGNDSPQQKIADMFVENFNDPILLTEAFHDKERARGVLRETFGSTRTPLLRGAVGIVRGQLRQRLGLLRVGNECRCALGRTGGVEIGSGKVGSGNDRHR
jgi:hypothetical protein